MTTRAPKALRVGAFRSFWAGQTISQFGDQVALFAIPTYALLNLQASETDVGALRAISTAAYPILGLAVGAYVEHVRRRRVMITADFIRFLIFVSVPVMAALDLLSIWYLFAVVAAGSVCSVFFDVAYQSYVPTILQGPALTDGNTKLELSNTVARLTGPTLAAQLIQLISAAGALAVNAVSFLASILGVLGGKGSEPPRSTPRQRRPPLHTQVWEGLRALRGLPLVWSLSIGSGVRNFGMSMRQTIVLVLLYSGLHASPIVASAILAAGAGSAVLGAMACKPITRWLGPRSSLIVSLIEGTAWLASPLGLWLAPIPTLLAITVVGSFWLPTWNVNVLTTRQTLTPAGVLSRVHSAARTVSLASVPAGAAVAGVLAALLSGLTNVVVGQYLTLAISGAVVLSALPFVARHGLAGDYRRLSEPLRTAEVQRT